MEGEVDTTQHLQNIVDKLKTASIIQNQHNLSPPVNRQEESGREIAIIEGLKSSPRLLKIYLEARGLELAPDKKTYIQKNHAYFNQRGALKFVQMISHIAEEIEFSNFHEDELPSRLVHIFERDITEMKINQELYDLETSDFNWVDSLYQTFVDASYHKAKGGKFINIVGKTYDERGIANILNPQQPQKQQKSFIEKLASLNPMTKM
jgi:hypothetical protein